MSLLKKLGLISEDETEIRPSTIKEAPVQLAMQGKTSSIQVTETPEAVNIVKIINDVITSANLEGPDFFEFMQALEKPALQTLPEENRYVSVFEIMGISKDKLLSTSQVYVNALDNEQHKFESVMSSNKQVKVDDVQTEIERLNSENVQMQDKIQSNLSSIATLTQQKNEAAAKISNVSSIHAVQTDVAKNRIQTIISNIQKYIK